jgi:hypothetical protein
MDYTHQIIGFNWQERQGVFSPFAEVRDLVTKTDTQIDLAAGYNFNWELSPDFYCPGYTDAEGHAISCPYNKRLDTKYERCYSCEQNDGFRLTFFMGVEPNEKVRAHLNQTHYVYIACFYPDIYKVGTAAKSRKRIRLIEQDALFAAFVAAAPGNEIQKWEAQIAVHLGLTRSVRANQKLAGAFTKINTQIARRTIASYFQSLRDAHELAGALLPEADFVDFTTQPHIYYHDDSNLFRIDTPTTLIGNYVGMRGKQLILGRGETNNIYPTGKVSRRLFKMLETL